MANTIEISQPMEDIAGSIPVTISLEDFHKAATEVYVHNLRNIAFLTGDDSVLSLVSIPAEHLSKNYIFDPDFSAEEIGVNYKLISNTEFAKTLDRIYDFAFFARLDRIAEQMGDETTYTQFSTLLADAAYGYAADYWADYGNPIMDHAKKCLLVAEIANARCVLEDIEAFFHFHISKDRGGAEDASDCGALTIRQMALLSGMEEQSVRAAANPKRSNRLITYNEDGRTRVSIICAKDWLKSKGKYIQVTHYVPDYEIDFNKYEFNSTNDLYMVIHNRYLQLISRGDKSELDTQLKEAGMESSINVLNEPGLFIDEGLFNDNEHMKILANLLQWPVKLFALRCRQLIAKNAAINIENELREVEQSLETK
jgi:hypothetical protein